MARQSPRSGSDFSANLRFLCDRAESVSRVCRDIGINRQQFNKYLSGAVRPSARNLRPIADHFGVAENAFDLGHAAFVDLVVERTPPADLPPGLAEFFDVSGARWTESAAFLRRYQGYYTHLTLSPVWPGQVIRSLCHLSVKDSFGSFKVWERLVTGGKREAAGYATKFRGMVLYENGRIFMLGQQTGTSISYGFTLLYPCHRTRLRYLTGLYVSTTSSNRRLPYATRIVLEFLGRQVQPREALSLCGLYREGGGEIAPDLLEKIRNPMAGDEVALVSTDL